ncbi:MAG: DUF3341 domain-containing protein [Deltaproteobacteria bacterium]|nr:DUF3341 domain-containing protein [Deltaproteobacteria bacterium]
MKNENKVVLGIFQDRIDVEAAVKELKAAGFRQDDVSALLPTPDTTKEFAHTQETKMPEGAATGAASGAIVGGTLGWLAGIGSIVIPGLGPFIAAGPIMGLLAGAGLGGAVGGVSGALIGLGIPEYVADRYEGRVKQGGILLSVHCDGDDWQRKAREILERCGATDISETEEGASDQPSEVEQQPPRSMA